VDGPLEFDHPTATNGPSPPERSLSVSSSFVYVVSFMIQLVGYVSSFFIARHIVAPGAGQLLVGFVQFNLLLATSINTLGELRLGTAFTYYVARDRGALKFTGSYFVARALFVLLFGAGLLAMAPFIGITSTSGALPIPAPTLYLCLGVFMLLPILWTPGMVYTQLHVGVGDAIRAQRPTIIESSVRTAALIAVAFTFPTMAGAVNSYAIWGLTFAFILGAAASAAWSLPTVWRHRSPVRWADIRQLLVYSWPLLGSMGLAYVATNAMAILARVFYNTAAVLDFNAANAFRILLLALPSAIVVPLFPHLAGLHQRQELAVLRDRIWRALRYTWMMVVPGAVLFVVYRVNLLLILLSSSFLLPVAGAGSTPIPLAILALSAIPLALSQIIGTALNSIGLQRLELYLTILQVAVLFAGIFGFLAMGGVFGFTGLAAIAFAALLSSVAGLALNAYFLQRKVRVPVRWKPVVTIVLAAAAEFLVMSRLNTVLPVNRWNQLLEASVLALGVYVTVLILVGELSREDIRLFARSLGLPARVGNALARVCWKESSDGPAAIEAPGGSPPSS
jgi:O-antigen/teichoic acid export membrane protein